MLTLRSLLLICFISTQTAYAQDENHCDLIYLNNNSGQSLEVNGTYPESNEELKTIVLEPYETQKSISLKTIGTCSGITSNIHCNAMWLVCHKSIKLIVKTIDTGETLLSELIHANDTVSINKCPAYDKPSIVLINDVPQY